MAAAFPLAGFAAGASAPHALNGPGVRNTTRVAVGSLVLDGQGCLVDYQVVAATDSASSLELRVYDDHRLILHIPLVVPADGVPHQVTGEFQLHGPPQSGNPGIGVYLFEGEQALAFVDPFDVRGCTSFSVPALGVAGEAGLALLLAAAAVVVLARRAS